MTELINNKNPGPLYAAGTAYANGFQDASGFFFNYACYQFSSINPLLSCQVRGLWRGRWIFQVRHGKNYFRRAAFKDLHKTKSTPPGMAKWAAAIAAWQGLSATTKRALDVRASQLGMHCSGFNYFTYLWMKDKLDLIKYYP